MESEDGGVVLDVCMREESKKLFYLRVRDWLGKYSIIVRFYFDYEFKMKLIIMYLCVCVVFVSYV